MQVTVLETSTGAAHACTFLRAVDGSGPLAESNCKPDHSAAPSRFPHLSIDCPSLLPLWPLAASGKLSTCQTRPTASSNHNLIYIRSLPSDHALFRALLEIKPTTGTGRLDSPHMQRAHLLPHPPNKALTRALTLTLTMAHPELGFAQGSDAVGCRVAHTAAPAKVSSHTSGPACLLNSFFGCYQTRNRCVSWSMHALLLYSAPSHLINLSA